MVQRARTVRSSSSDDEDSIRNDKLVNIVYNDGLYYIYEPGNVEASPSNVIDNNLWLAARFMPNVRPAPFTFVEASRDPGR